METTDIKPPVYFVGYALGSPSDEQEEDALQDAVNHCGITTELPYGTLLVFTDRAFVLAVGAGPAWVEVAHPELCDVCSAAVGAPVPRSQCSSLTHVPAT